MDEIERFRAVQAIEADLMQRHERLAAERRRAAYQRRAERARMAQATTAAPDADERRTARRWSMPGSRAWRMAR